MKSEFAPEELAALAGKWLSEEIEAIQPVRSGQVSKAFIVSTKGGPDYILRVNEQAIFFQRDAWIYRRYAHTGIPVPEVIALEERGDFAYAISRRMPGQMLMELPEAEVTQLLPRMIEMLDRIHHCDVSESRGYGPLDREGNGMFASWTDYLLSVNQGEQAERMERAYRTTCLDRGLCTRLYENMRALSTFCPQERYLIHGDYSFDNVLTEGGEISAVLDWGSASYGDYLFDVSWGSFWDFGGSFFQAFKDYSQFCKTPIPTLEERIQCYHCYISLVALLFFAERGQTDVYQMLKQAILTELSL
uniref:Aminoglycoside phosphotransferase domain-containing protein n=1 Tax=Thermosporothrix sp. COM3 TaxID=2490863 RepID=A0A455SSW7_9CHLR|nr:hypothetical protein KTC_62640 [Thermosporothrix sp. COM3]